LLRNLGNQAKLHHRETCLGGHDDALAHVAALDFLGRMPVPLRQGSAAGLDRQPQAPPAAGGFALSRAMNGMRPSMRWRVPNLSDLLKKSPSDPPPGID
jgi:hypothetical protein